MPSSPFVRQHRRLQLLHKDRAALSRGLERDLSLERKGIEGP